MSFPQCPRCGDNLSELVPSDWNPGDGQDVPPFCTISVCTVCAAELAHRRTALDTDAADVQKALARAAAEAAFPRPHSRSHNDGSSANATGGITILDYFAAKVAAGVCAKIGFPWHTESDDVPDRVERAAEKFGRMCYALARGLAAARPKS